MGYCDSDRAGSRKSYPALQRKKSSQQLEFRPLPFELLPKDEDPEL